MVQVEVKLEDAEISDDSDEEDQAAEAAAGIETSRGLDGDDDDDAAGRAPQDRDARWLAVLGNAMLSAEHTCILCVRVRVRACVLSLIHI